MERDGRLAADRFRIDERLEIRVPPIPVRVRVVDFDDVSAEREHDGVPVGGREREVTEAVCPDLLSHPF